MPLLGVNIDHVATLRQARLTSLDQIGSPAYPDPLKAAQICRRSGAHSVVMHLREDRRHIQDIDVFRVKKAVGIRLNLEMSIAPSVVTTALKCLPDQVTLVPERRQEKTTEGGLDLFYKSNDLARTIDKFRRKKIVVSLFIDPDPRQIGAVRKLGADTVEFHTGDYANQATAAGRKKELLRLNEAVKLAQVFGIATHAGHGLDYENTLPVARIPGMGELNIGYSIVSRALWVGFEQAVKDMVKLVR